MAMAARGYATVVSNADEDDGLQEKLVASMIEHGVDAVVISPAYGDPAAVFDPLAKAGIPAMQVLRRMDARTDQFPFSSFDYAAGSAEATRHLIADRRAAHRLRGRARRTVDHAGTDGRVSLRAGRKACRRCGSRDRHRAPSAGASRHALRRDHPECDAVVCFNDLVALGLIAGLQRDGVAVGRDIRVVGFDDIEEAALAWPDLSSVSCDIAGFGQDTARALLDWLDNGTRPPAERRAPVTLKVRASSGGVMP
jgi:LacI family transcriptional regulator